MAGYVMTRNAASEVRRAQMVRALGPEKTLEFAPLNPPKTIDIPQGLNLADIDDGILKGMQTGGLEYQPVESNNWVIDGTKSITGKPLLSNDPHRDITNPSLRYIVHLVGPGWNVIGSGEPALPGISIGHNEYIAWGFTILGIDQQDLYVEETDPQNPNRYKYRESWLDMRVEKDQIKVKGQAPVEVELKFTRHGPVVHEDRGKNRAYVLRWIGAEPGTAGYLGALALNQAKNWQEFKKGAEQWKLPSHNLVYADVQGNIAYHGVGLTPVRRGWDGLLPVPGSTGQYEWDGFLPMSELPNYVNPSQHFIATANHNVIPRGYKHIIGNELSSSFRYDRIVEVLRGQQKFSIGDLGNLQHDATSLVARSLVPLLKDVTTDNPELRQALDLLLSWNYWVGRDLAAAVIYEFWYMKLAPSVYKPRVPENVWSLVQGRYSTERVIQWLQKASPERDRILLTSLEEALVDLTKLLGHEMTKWRWGQLHVIDFPHPIAYSDELKAIFDLKGPARDGDGNTVLATTSPSANNIKQRGGASYRHIIDLADWDRSVGANVPGQSAQPGSSYYSNLIEIWGKNEFFPLVYSKAKVIEHAKYKLVLKPGS
jgi:penicillin amidase